MKKRPKYVLYLAVLPFYRDACMRELINISSGQVRLFAGRRHIDSTVTTGIDPKLYTCVTNVILFSRILIQLGGLHDALRADVTIVDLNPRSVTAWLIIAMRRIYGRRTLAWGHLHPRQGASSWTAKLRLAMRRFSSGVVLYGYDSVAPALAELPRKPVWVAPNALYPKQDLLPPDFPTSCNGSNLITYVGRLEPSKKVQDAIHAFSASGLAGSGVSLAIVGQGTERQKLETLASSLGVREHVRFLGKIANPGDLRQIYHRTLVSISPGYVGLSLTQSLGFGIPMIISRDELHAPEIELRRFGGVTFFETGDVSDFAQKMVEAAEMPRAAGQLGMAANIAEFYSAESMAMGLLDALNDVPQSFGADGWPRKK